MGLTMWKGGHVGLHPADLTVHVVAETHDRIGRSVGELIDDDVDDLIGDAVTVNGLNGSRNAGGGVLPGLVAAAFSARVAKGWRCTTSLVGDAIERSVRRILSASFSAPAWQRLRKMPRSPGVRLSVAWNPSGALCMSSRKPAEDAACVVNGVMDVAGNDRADGMEFGFEGCRDAEVCAGTAESPKELGISLSVHIQCVRIGGDEVRGKEVVTAGAEEP